MHFVKIAGFKMIRTHNCYLFEKPILSLKPPSFCLNFHTKVLPAAAPELKLRWNQFKKISSCCLQMCSPSTINYEKCIFLSMESQLGWAKNVKNFYAKTSSLSVMCKTVLWTCIFVFFMFIDSPYFPFLFWTAGLACTQAIDGKTGWPAGLWQKGWNWILAYQGLFWEDGPFPI